MLLPLIPTRVHGMIDYIVGIVLFISPWLFGFSHDRLATLVPVVLGLGTIVYSLLTNYEIGVVHAIPMIAHLWIDLLAGLLLLLSPWLLGFAHHVTWPHVIIGALEIMVVLVSSRVPGVGHPHDATGEGDVGRPHMV
jgi:SPW repeat-containing protein